jgi:hypothetical protein
VPLDGELRKAAQSLLEPKQPTGVPERLGRPAVGEPSSDLVTESEPEPDRHLTQEVAPPVRQAAFEPPKPAGGLDMGTGRREQL